MALIGAIVHFSRLASVKREIAQSNVQVAIEPSNTAQTNLHFEGLHVSPHVQ